MKVSAIEMFQELAIEEKRSLLRVLGKSGIDNMSETMVKAELFKKVEDNPKNFLDIAKDLNMKIRALILEAVEKKVLVKRSSTFFYGEDAIGNSTDETLDYLTDIKNQTIKLAIENKVKKLRK